MESSSTPPLAKSSQPLHNFELPHLKWNMLGQSSSQKKRSRSMKSPPGRHAASPPDQAARLLSPPPAVASPAGGESEKVPVVRDEAVRPFRKRSWVWESEASKVNSDVGEVKGAPDEKKVEGKVKAEDDGVGIKRSKILIKIPNIKSKKEEIEGVAVAVAVANGEREGGDLVQDKGKNMSGDLDNETKISEFKTKKVVKSKSQKGEKGGVFRVPVPEKNKAQPVVMKVNANKSGVKEGAIGGGVEKKEMISSNGGTEKKIGGGEMIKKKEKEMIKKKENEIIKKKEKDEGEMIKKKEKGEGEMIKKKENGEGEIIKKKKVSGDKAKAGGSNGGHDKKAKAGGGDQKTDKMKVGNGSEKMKGSGKKVEGQKVVEKKEKKKLSISISLTNEEIEEDIYALTGAKPARRPKKRSKNVQKNLDAVFPGLWLVSISPETYKG